MLRSPEIPTTKWHMPFVHQQLMWAMEETFWRSGCVKFANINLVSNWTAKLQLNGLAFKFRSPWLHGIQSQSESDLILWAIQRHNPLIDKAKWGEMSERSKKRLVNVGGGAKEGMVLGEKEENRWGEESKINKSKDKKNVKEVNERRIKWLSKTR